MTWFEQIGAAVQHVMASVFYQWGSETQED